MSALAHPVESLFQERAESRNNVADQLGQLMKRWEQRITLSNRRIGERWLAREIHVLFLLQSVKTGKEWVVGLERDSVHDEVVADRKDETVLIGVVELVEQP